MMIMIRMAIKELWEAIYFMCSAEFWRMAVLWNLSIIVSYLQLFVPRLFDCKTNVYPRCLPRWTIRPICIVTGATSGLGAATACALSREGYYVVLAGRSMDLLQKTMMEIKNKNKDANLIAFQVDLSSFRSIMNFKSSLEQWLLDSDVHASIQLLVNNAGILATSSRLTSEGYDQMIATNYVGAFSLTKALLPLLIRSPIPSRIVNVTSFTHRSLSSDTKINKETVTGKYFLGLRRYPCAQIYEYSKFCLLLLSYKLHQQIQLMDKSCQVSVLAADPGIVETNIMREIPYILSRSAFVALKLIGLLHSAEDGARSILDACFAPEEVSGVYFFGGKGRTINSSAFSYNPMLADELWIVSSHLFDESNLHH